MRLIVGGAFQGKKEAALAMTGLDEGDVTNGAQCTAADLQSAVLLVGFHELVRRALRGDESLTMEDVEAFVRDAGTSSRDLTIVANELGCGIVPMETADRVWREKTGRLLCEIAGRADEVYTVTAGILLRIR